MSKKIPLKQLEIGAPTNSTPGVIKTGHTETINEHPLCVDSNGKGFVKENIFWGSVSTYTSPYTNNVVPQITISTSSNPDLPETPPSIITVLITQFVIAPIYATDNPEVGPGRVVWNNTVHGLLGLEMQDIVHPVPNNTSNWLLLTIYTGDSRHYIVLTKFVSPKAKKIYIDPDTNADSNKPYKRILLEGDKRSLYDIVNNTNVGTQIDTPVLSKFVGISKDGNLFANSIQTSSIIVGSSETMLLGGGDVSTIYTDKTYFENDYTRNAADGIIEGRTYGYPYNIPLINNSEHAHKDILFYNTSHNDCFIKSIAKRGDNILAINRILSPNGDVLPSVDGIILNQYLYDRIINIYQDDYNMFSAYTDPHNADFNQEWFDYYIDRFAFDIAHIITRTGTMYIICTDPSAAGLQLHFDVDNVIYRISPSQINSNPCALINGKNKDIQVKQQAVEIAPVIVRLTWDYMTANKTIVVDVFQGDIDTTTISQPAYDTRKL